jgi:hypothetical protein
MSTILKTLRKLEKEKNILNQKLDLRGMLLKEDTTYPKSIKWDPSKFFLLLTMVAIFLITGGTAFYYWTPNYGVSNSPKHVSEKILIQQPAPQSKDSSRLRAFEGVPMTAILNNELTSQLEPNKHISSKNVTEVNEKTPPKSISTDLEGIKKFVRHTAALTKKKSNISPTIQSGIIPGIKIKGIIFFDKGSSSNHVIANTKNNSNLKLRIGEAFKDAVLKSIYPSHVIFLYHDELVKVGIGQ